MSASAPAPGGAVDVHVHVTVPGLLWAPGHEDSWRPRVERDAEGRQVRVELGGRPMRSIVAELADLQVILEGERRRGVDRLVVSPWVSTLPLEMDPGAAAEVCRVQNAALASAVQARPHELRALAAVPLQDGELAATVLDEARALGLAGAEVTPSVQNRWLGDPWLEPFFSAAAALEMPVFVHPGTHGLGIDVFEEYYLWNAVANPVETAAAAAHLVLAGTLERNPGLQIVLAHGGGVLGSLVGRLERAFSVRSESRAKLHEGPRASVRRLYVDSVTHDRAVLGGLVDLLGSGHVLLGSDHPFDMGSDDPVGEVLALGLDERATRRILAENAVALFFSRE